MKMTAKNVIWIQDRMLSSAFDLIKTEKEMQPKSVAGLQLGMLQSMDSILTPKLQGCPQDLKSMDNDWYSVLCLFMQAQPIANYQVK